MTSRQSKVISVDQAAARVSTGSHLAVGGIWNENVPSSLLHAVVQSGVGELRVSAGPAAGYGLDFLLRAGVVSEALVANITFEHLGLAPGLRQAAATNAVRIIDIDEAILIGGYKAAAAGLPATIIRSLLGTELDQRQEVMSRTTLPDGAVVGLAGAIRPDVVFLHSAYCDEFGNAVCCGAVFVDRLLAKAAKTVVVSTEEIVTNDFIRADPQRTTIPSYLVDAVVLAPNGALPCGSHGRYAPDEVALRMYLDSASEGSGMWSRYLESCAAMSGEAASTSSTGQRS